MFRKQVYLDPEQERELKRMAGKNEASLSAKRSTALTLETSLDK
jgi:hypothetical protein